MVINGNDLKVSLGEGTTHALLCSTSCSLTINQDTIDSSCKNSGAWGEFIAGGKSWEVSADGVYKTSEFLSVGVKELTEFIINST
jgi:predicted secreted protein